MPEGWPCATNICRSLHFKKLLKFLFIYLFIYFYFNFYFILLYNAVLVLPYIDMNSPRVYMSSQSWTPLPSPTQYHLSRYPRAPAPSILYPVSNIDWWFISYMIVYMFQCHSPKSSHPLPLPQSPKVLYMEFRKMVIITLYVRQQKRHRCRDKKFLWRGEEECERWQAEEWGKGREKGERRKKESKLVLGLEEIKPRINNAATLLRNRDLLQHLPRCLCLKKPPRV